VPAAIETLTEDMDEIEKRDKNMYWKIKGVAGQMTYRLFSKYGNPKYAEDKLSEFSKAFRDKYSLPLLESHLTLLLKRKMNFIGSKSLNYSIKYVSQCTKMPHTMNKLKPFVEKLLTEVIIAPIMMITHKDVTLFKEDPIEYVRKQNDFTETLFAPKNNSVDLLMYLCKYRSSKK
jgi:importin-7